MGYNSVTHMIENLPRLFDPAMAKTMMTMKEAAEYLDIHPVSVRRLVSRGIVKPRYRVGKTVLLLQEDLDRYKWKGGLPNPPAWGQNQLKAEILIEAKNLRRSFEKLKGFSWDGIPFVRNRVIRKYGNVSFVIRVDTADGGSWNISYSHKKSKSAKRLKFGKGDYWLVG